MKFENTKIFNIEGALRGMRFPMKSASDTVRDIIGEKDMNLARRLYLASERENLAHSKFLRQIFVSVDISAPLYFWSEIDQYRIGVTTNSESTMHKLIKDAANLTFADFEVDDEEVAFLANTIIPKLQEISSNPNYSEIKKLRLLKQNLPTSYIQKRHWTGNYEIVRNMYNQREHHRLTEWNTGFANWVKTLPYADEFLTRKCKGEA